MASTQTSEACLTLPTRTSSDLPQEPGAAVAVTSRGKNSWGTPEHPGHVRTLVYADDTVFHTQTAGNNAFIVVWLCTAVVPSALWLGISWATPQTNHVSPLEGPQAILEPPLPHVGLGVHFQGIPVETFCSTSWSCSGSP